MTDNAFSSGKARLQQLLADALITPDEYAVLLARLAGIDVDVASGAASIGDDNTTLGERAANVGGSVYGDLITGNVYHGDPTDDPQEAIRIYREVIFHGMNRLPLRGMVKRRQHGSALTLANVYIDLDTTIQKQREKRGRELDEAARLRSEQREPDPVTALAALLSNRRMVLTGDPGSGKSTFVRHLAFCLAAHHVEPDGGWLEHLTGWNAAQGDMLPLVVILRDFARSFADALPTQANSNHLWQFITAQLAKQNLAFAERPLRRLLEQGRVLVLLDGLDEVPTVAQRIFVRDAVERFAQRFQHNRFLVTVRVLSYQPPAEADDDGIPDLRLSTDSFPIFELAPFSEAKIDRFVDVWYREMARIGELPDVTKVDALIAELQQAARRPGLRRLAPNPLLLNVMAYVHHNDGRLPNARALLYERAVVYLLYRWDEQKRDGSADVSPLSALLAEADRSEIDLRRVLWRLAYDTHAQIADAEDDEAVADIGETVLRRALAELNKDKMTGHPDWNWANRVLETIRERAGLLIEREPGVFAFPHRTFQEYLAGAHLANLPDFGTEAARLLRAHTVWREVVLLAVGNLIHSPQGGTAKPLLLIGELCPDKCLDSDVGWQQAWLAGAVTREIGVRRMVDSTTGSDLLARVRGRLAQLLDESHLSPRERAEAGDTLADIGDPRRGVGVRVPRPGADPLPDIVWCAVPAGPFLMGSDDTDALAAEREKPQHEVIIPYDYWMARYPVTVAQYRQFVTATGHKSANRDSLRDPDNRPVRRVTWYEALAFCRWLDEQAHEHDLLPARLHVTLPTEAEWEKATRGGVVIPNRPLLSPGWPQFTAPMEMTQANPEPGRRFVWGGTQPTDEHLNWGKSGVGDTSAVGAFVKDSSPYGVRDMAGNVNEWTRTRWGSDFNKATYKYPYHFDDDRDSTESRDLRIWRGGAYDDNESWTRCAVRDWDLPPYRIAHIGFRIVVSPFFAPLNADASDL